MEDVEHGGLQRHPGLDATLDDGLILEAELFGQVFRTSDAAGR